MQRKLKRKIEQYVKSNRQNNIWHKCVRVVAGVVVFCTTYSLILPALTLEQETFCEQEEHTHSSACYIQTSVSHELVCGLEAVEQHVHGNDCYTTPEASADAHTHSDACRTKERGDLACAQTEEAGHTHTDACYGESELICQTAETAGHTHDTACYTSIYDPTCTLTEDAEHVHGDECSTIQSVLSCTQTEQDGHTHGDGCYEKPLICGQEEVAGHTHTDDCYNWTETIACGLEETPAPQPQLTCTITTPEGHVHGEECYQKKEQELTCQLAEGSEHTHNAQCYGTWELACPTEEHTHELACFSDPEADLETEEVWKKTLPEKLTGVYVDDLLAAADSQLNYTESEKNYAVLEDGTTMRGYTRYGAWYGDLYGEWDGMFASFVLYYSGADKLEALADFPLEADAAQWVKKLEEAETEETELYVKAEEGTPEPGDLVFFDFDGDEQNTPDHVGILMETFVDELDGITKLRVYEGDSENQVRKNVYELPIFEENAEAPVTPIVGYGILPEVPDYDPDGATETTTATEATETTTATEATEAMEIPSNIYSYSDDTLYVEVELPEDTDVPADAVLQVTTIAAGDEKYDSYVAQAEETVDGTVANIALYDISFYANDTYYPVGDTANVTMAFKESPVSADAQVQVVHFAGEEETPMVLGKVSFAEKEVKMLLKDVKKAVKLPTAAGLERKAQLSEAPKSFMGKIADFFNPSMKVKSAAETQPVTETTAATEAAAETTAPETELAQETTATVETVTEERTVIEFTTDGFSTFAVVEVEKGNIVTNIIKSNSNTNLNNKIMMISTADKLLNGTEYAMSSDASTTADGQRAAVMATRNNDVTVTVTPDQVDNIKKLQWKFIADDNTGKYFIQSVATGDYLQLPNNGNNVNLVPEANKAPYYVIRAYNYEGNQYGVNYTISTENGHDDGSSETKGRKLSFNNDTNGNIPGPAFATYGTATTDAGVERDSLILSEFAITEIPVTNLGGQSFAIVSVHSGAGAVPQVMTSVSNNDANYPKLNGVVSEWTNKKLKLVDVPATVTDEELYWTFTAVPDKAGVYTIENNAGKFLNIGNGTATMEETAQEITVIQRFVGDEPNLVFYVTVGNTRYYLNRHGGAGYKVYGGYGAADEGSNFVLAKRATFTGEIISRADVYNSARTAGTKLIFFVRQTDANGTDHYYALNANGNATEVFLQDDLAAGDMIYGTSTNDQMKEFLWDASDSLIGSWNGDERGPNGFIDIQPVTLSETLNDKTGWVLLPNLIDGIIGNPETTPTLLAKPNQHDGGAPMRGKHVPTLSEIKSQAAGVNIDTSIASVYSACPELEDKPGSYWCAVQYDGEKFVAVSSNNGNAGNDPFANNVNDSFAIYVAAVSYMEELEEIESSDTLWIKTLSRHELHDAALMDQAKLILFTKIKENGEDHYYAIDAYGNAKPLTSLSGNVVSGSQFEFYNGDINDETGEFYNSNLLIWNPLSTQFDDNAENTIDNGFIDLWLLNEGTETYYGSDDPGMLTTFGSPVDTDHAPGFYGGTELNLGVNTTKVANVLAVGDDTNGYSILKYSEEEGKFVVETGKTRQNIIGIDGNDEKNPEYIIYVGLVVDRVSNANEPSTSINPNYMEYAPINADEEYVRMYVFNYGSSISDYGAQQNTTTGTTKIEQDNDLDKLVTYTFNDTLYRFFQRTEFGGEAIDGTNERVDEYAKSDPFEGRPGDNGPLEFSRVLDDYPTIKIPDASNVKNATMTYSLQYLFDTNVSFAGGTRSRVLAEVLSRADHTRVAITNDNNDINNVAYNGSTDEFGDEAKGTQGYDDYTKEGVIDTSKATATANAYNPVNNPNYSVKSYRVSDGKKTGLFQKDYNGFYYYDSRVNAAYFEPTSDMMGVFRLYDYAVIPAGSSDLRGGNFLPFNKGHTSGHLVENSSGDAPILPTLSKASRVYRLNGVHQDSDGTIGRNSVSDMWFGMYMEIDFTMTRDGRVGVLDSKGRAAFENETGTRYYLDERTGAVYAAANVEGALNGTFGKITTDTNGYKHTTYNGQNLTEVRNDLEFNFSGDDDVLVYIDDVLVLDISGIHGVAEGKINFRTGETHSDIDKGLTVDDSLATSFTKAGVAMNGGIATAAEGDTALVDTTKTFEPGSNHTLKFYYLERGGNISDCAISYNIEPLETGKLTITKQVEGLDEDDEIQGTDGLDYSYDSEYSFQLVDLVQPFDTYNPNGVTDLPYTIYDGDNNVVGSGTMHLIPQLANGGAELELNLDGGGTVKHVFEECRYYPAGILPTQSEANDTSKYYIVYRYQDDAAQKVYFYTDVNEAGDTDGSYSVTEVELGSVVSSETNTFFKVYESGVISNGTRSQQYVNLKSGETAVFDDFVEGTLVKVKELPTTSGVKLDTTYWWRVTSTNDSSVSQTGQHEGTEDGIGAHVSQYFKIVKETNVDVICRNILQPVNLGIRKVLLNPDGSQSEDTVTEFSIKYTIQYPNSQFFAVEENSDGTKKIYKIQPDGSSEDRVLLRETNTETWALKNKATYAPPATTVNEGDYYKWTTNIPFGSNVTIEEITVNGYDVTWEYEGWDANKVAVATEGITVDGVTYKKGDVLDGAAVEALNSKSYFVYDEEIKGYIVLQDIADYQKGDVIDDPPMIDNVLAPYEYKVQAAPRTGWDPIDVYRAKNPLGTDVLTLAHKDDLVIFEKDEILSEEIVNKYHLTLNTEYTNENGTYKAAQKLQRVADEDLISIAEGELLTDKDGNVIVGDDLKNFVRANSTNSDVFTSFVGVSESDYTKDVLYEINSESKAEGDGCKTDQIKLLAMYNYVTIYNTPRPDITITKYVVDTDGKDIKSNDTFTFHYWLKNADGKYIDASGTELTYTGDKPKPFEQTLGDNGKAVIENVPIGSYIEIAETADSAAGYYTSYMVQPALIAGIEAEDGTDNTGEIRETNAETHSGGAYVGGWDNGGSATYTFNSEAAGYAIMEIYGCCWDNRDLVVTINGKTQTVNTVGNGSWDATNGSILATVIIPVIAGENTMVVGGPATGNAPNVDCFKLYGVSQNGTSVSEADIVDSISIHFINTTGYELPESGGTGTYLYTMGGLMLTIAAAILLYSKSKRGKEELASS